MTNTVSATFMYMSKYVVTIFINGGYTPRTVFELMQDVNYRHVHKSMYIFCIFVFAAYSAEE